LSCDFCLAFVKFLGANVELGLLGCDLIWCHSRRGLG
jgi:hypothetical protein